MVLIVGLSPFLPEIFTVRRGYEGPQVIIEWNDPDDPGGVVSFRLVRRLFGFPTSLSDGLVLFDGAPAANVIADLGVEACKCYYYKLFATTTIGDIVTAESTQNFVIPVQTGFFADFTFDILPESLKLGDKGQQDETEFRLALTEGPFSGTFPEVFNLGEDGSVLKGPYQRFWKIMGPMLDEPKGLLDCLLNQLDVDEACLPNLEHLATLLGLSLNKELTSEKFRNEVRLQVEFLKIKGTIPGLQARMRSISGLTPDIQEQCDNVFFTNDLTCTTLGFTAAERFGFGQFGDTVCQLAGFPDTIPFWLWFTVFMALPDEFVLDEATARKWCLAIEDASPACHKGFLHITDSNVDAIGITMLEETEDIEQVSDAIPIGLVDVPTDTQTADASLWLIISDPTKTIGAPNYTAVFAVATIP